FLMGISYLPDQFGNTPPRSFYLFHKFQPKYEAFLYLKIGIFIEDCFEFSSIFILLPDSTITLHIHSSLSSKWVSV
ncbi:MAG TPA: hypothetical protein DEP37_00720, partial [Algoriphagus sp.]|uniref:hypothetical protein n=1 Tax=Algoriphagus sp. TaxID=1872435 RepID=UPI000ED56C00